LLVGGDGKRPRIAEFEGRGELSSWVSVSAMRIAQNLIRDEGRSAARDVDVRSAWEQAIDALGTGDIELDHLKLQYSDAFSTAIRSAFYELPGREQMLLQLYFAGSFKIHEIAATYQVPRSTAGRWVLQARRQLFLRTCARVRGSLGMSASEVTSLWRKILSRLSLDHMLEQRTDPRRWPPQQNSMPE
jgi:RNA polymerase sigma-70 factor (ECF subfamily)